MKKIYLFSIISIFVVAGMLGMFDIALAQATEPTRLTNPISGNPSINELLGRIITAVLGVIGSLTLVAFIVGGFLWLTSGGNSDKIKKGANTMIYAVIGLFIIFSAYAILRTIIGGLKDNNNTGNISCSDFASEGFACLPIERCAGLPQNATWNQCKTIDDNICKVNACSGGNNIVCCKSS